jgi:hypothetical protein
VYGIKTPASGELLRGSAYHKALEFAYRVKRDYNGEMPALDDVLRVYTNEWNTHAPDTDFEGKESVEMMDAGARLLGIYYNSILPAITPVAVEVRKYITLHHDGIDVPLLGFIDLVLANDDIIDHKTTSRQYTEQQLQTNTQSSFYGILLGYEKDYDFIIHQAIAKRTPEVLVTPIHRNSSDIDWMKDMIVKIWRQINAGVFAPNPYGFWCGTGCKYHSYCHMVDF